MGYFSIIPSVQGGGEYTQVPGIESTKTENIVVDSLAWALNSVPKYCWSDTLYALLSPQPLISARFQSVPNTPPILAQISTRNRS